MSRISAIEPGHQLTRVGSFVLPAVAEPVLPPPTIEKKYRQPVVPDRELNLDGMVPPPLVKLPKRLAKRSELLKLYLKHYRMSSAVQAPGQ